MSPRRFRQRSAAAPQPPEEKPEEQHVPLRKKTAENIVALNKMVADAQAALQVVQARMSDTLAAILTQNGIEEAEVLGVKDDPPYLLKVLVKKRATGD